MQGLTRGWLLFAFLCGACRSPTARVSRALQLAAPPSRRAHETRPEPIAGGTPKLCPCSIMARPMSRPSTSALCLPNIPAAYRLAALCPPLLVNDMNEAVRHTLHDTIARYGHVELAEAMQPPAASRVLRLRSQTFYDYPR